MKRPLAHASVSPSHHSIILAVLRVQAASFVLLLAGVCTVSAQNNACTKNCLDPQDGPCSGLQGRAHAQCLGQCMQSCKTKLPPPSFKAMDVVYSPDLIDLNGLAQIRFGSARLRPDTRQIPTSFAQRAVTTRTNGAIRQIAQTPFCTLTLATSVLAI